MALRKKKSAKKTAKKVTKRKYTRRKKVATRKKKTTKKKTTRKVSSLIVGPVVKKRRGRPAKKKPGPKPGKRATKKKTTRKVAKTASGVKRKKVGRPSNASLAAAAVAEATKTMSRPQVKEYRVLSFDQLRLLEDEVNYLISKGWEPHGGLMEENAHFFQAMVKIDED